MIVVGKTMSELNVPQQAALLKAFSTKDKAISNQGTSISILTKLECEGLLWRQGRLWPWGIMWYGLTAKGKAAAKKLKQEGR